MKALVTGGGGFLGRHIVAALRARDVEVRVLGRSAYPDLAARAGVETVQADIGDAHAVAAACAGVDVVYHVAALAGIWGDPAVYRRINVDGTANVLAGCRAHGVGRLVHTSTPSVVYGTDPVEGIDESAPFPDTYLAEYPKTKAEAERQVLAADGDGLRTTALRPHLIWGPGDNHLIPRVVQRARAGRLVQVGDGTNKVDVIHVTNAARAHLLADDCLVREGPACGRAYFLSQGEPVLLWGFLARVLERLGLPPVSRSISFKAAWRLGATLESVYRLARIRREPPMTRFVACQLATAHWFDISAARADLGYVPEVSIDQGLEGLFAHLSGAHDAGPDATQP